MQLRHHHSLCAIDDKRALRRHQRDFAHVNLLFLRPLLLLQLKGDMERRAVSLSLALRLQRRQFWFTDLEMAEIQRGFLIVALDRKNFLKYGLQAVVLPLAKGHVLLQEIDVRVQLNFDEIWRLNAFFDTAEMNALCPF